MLKATLEAGAESPTRRAARRADGKGKPPTRRWGWGGREVTANTKSEARAKLKKLAMACGRLPPGVKVRRLKEV